MTRPSIECHDPVEFDYYRQSKKEWCDETLCAYCAGGSGEGGIMDEEASQKLFMLWFLFATIAALREPSCPWPGDGARMQLPVQQLHTRINAGLGIEMHVLLLLMHGSLYM